MADEANLRSGFGGTLTFGRQPALLVVDFQRAFTEPDISPLASDCTQAIEYTNRLIELVRPRGPVFFTVCSYDRNLRDAGCWLQKGPTLGALIRGTAACELDPRLSYEPGSDLVLHKTQASAFFGTPLAGILAADRIDTVIIAGCTTSGCVRASTVDAMQHGFPPFVVGEACADRSRPQHESNLIDMASKYAEVVDIEEIANLLTQ